MSNLNSLDAETAFGSHNSIGLYGMYVLMGHGLFYPEDYRRTEIELDQTSAAAARHVEFLHTDPEKRLIEQLGCVVKAALLEMDLPRRVASDQNDPLQTYLVKEVAPQGKEYGIRISSFDRKDQDLEELETPFSDRRVFEGVLRYKKSGRIAGSFLRYATLERLLPGYAPATRKS